MTDSSRAVDEKRNRIPVGVWTEWPVGARWTNEGMTRLLGYILEGVARRKRHVFHIVVSASARAEVLEDLATLQAQEGVDYVVHAPADREIEADDFSALARFANARVNVGGWISLYPQFRHSALLKAPVATIFPDGIPLAFATADPHAWGPAGYHLRWRDYVQASLNSSRCVITFSDHVARAQATPLFGVDRDKICVIPHAPPDLAHLAPYAPARHRSDASRTAAAEILRAHAAARGLPNLASFPFEQVDYIAISTQDRVTKNIRIVVEAVRGLVRERRLNVKIIMTAPVHHGAQWTPLPALLAREQLGDDVISMTDLPRDVHAAFYHCSAATVHGSVFEGGRGVFPYYEAVSVGAPCLMADGPHTAELVREAPVLADYVFDPNDSSRLQSLIEDALRLRDAMWATQAKVYDQLRRRQWADVADDYATAALSGASGSGRASK